jgi:hypothetical protein
MGDAANSNEVKKAGLVYHLFFEKNLENYFIILPGNIKIIKR